MDKISLKILIFPIGSYEYHGEKLPPDTDSLIANHITNDIFKLLKQKYHNNIIILPSLNFSLSIEHSNLPNTAHISHKTFYDFIFELFNSLVKNNTIIIIINAHGGNIHTLASIEADFNYTHKNCKIIAPNIYSSKIKELCVKFFGEFDTHSGSVESSLIAFYQNKQVKKEYKIIPSKKFSGSLRFFKTEELYPQGIIKELPIVIADPKKGKILHNEIINYLYSHIIDLIIKINSSNVEK